MFYVDFTAVFDFQMQMKYRREEGEPNDSFPGWDLNPWFLQFFDQESFIKL